MRKEYRIKEQEGYTDAEWIMPVGKCIINTGLKNLQDTTQWEFEFKVNISIYRTYSRMLIYTIPNGGVQIYTNSYDMYNQSAHVSLKPNKDVIYKCITTPTTRYIEEVGGLYYTQYFSRSITDGSDMYLFNNKLYELSWEDKLYYLKIRRNDILVRDFVPKVRNADGVAGLFDNIDNTFYTSQGEGYLAYGLKN